MEIMQRTLVALNVHGHDVLGTVLAEQQHCEGCEGRSFLVKLIYPENFEGIKIGVLLPDLKPLAQDVQSVEDIKVRAMEIILATLQDYDVALALARQ